jgi:Cu-Zn family superoxide dismutase
MTRYHYIAAALALLAAATSAQAAQKAHAIAHLKDRDGKPVGMVDFAAVNRGVLVTFDLHDLAPGAHGIHLHTSGNCDAKSGFTAAGPILTLVPGKQHGYLAEGVPEAGDLPNQFAGADGHLHASVVANGFGLGNGKRSIFDHDGVAIIVDARADDYRTQPLGNAGDRIACGVVMRTAGPKARHKKPH